MTVFIGKEENVRWRALIEEHERDSFENLLFSVCRFRELTSYPDISLQHNRKPLLLEALLLLLLVANPCDAREKF